jgi:hypothetical protein
MRGTYVPGLGRAFVAVVHEWERQGPALRTACGGVTSLPQHVKESKGPVSCPACLQQLKRKGGLTQW